MQLSGRIVVPNRSLEVVLAPSAGRVEALLVDPGQLVRPGQPLARLHGAEILTMQRELVTSRAQAQAVRTRASRDEQLHADGIIARNRLEETQALLADAEARLREQIQLLQLAGMSAAAVGRIQTAADIQPVLILNARRAGSVLQQLVTPGEAVEAGTPLLRIASLDVLWAELQATREQAARIRVGDRALVSGCSRAGKVLASALQLNDASQTIAVRVELSQAAGCVAPNQFVEARLAPAAAAAGLVQVPAASVVQHQGGFYVFVRGAQGVEPRIVTVERRSDRGAWISGAVRPGDAVASTGLAAIKGSWLGLGVVATTGAAP
jgi:membrane fusion protein, heavy metal efflux system